jgi:hypothetical protein
MNTQIEKPEYELIETMLETLKSAHTGINAELEYLVESVGNDEEEYRTLKNEIGKLYVLNTAMQQFIAATLKDDFNGAIVRDDLLKIRLKRLLTGDKDSALNWFAKKYLDEN